jgi:hypothetical protein
VLGGAEGLLHSSQLFSELDGPCPRCAGPASPWPGPLRRFAQVKEPAAVTRR